ncbi:MAG: aspartyl protease family protein [Thermodesulfobacteriota bacterium]
MRLALDAGATGSVAGWDRVVFLGCDPAIISERIRMTTGSGVEFVPRVIIERIEAFKKKRRDFPVLRHNMPPSATVDGVLGLDFLGGQGLW